MVAGGLAVSETCPQHDWEGQSLCWGVSYEIPYVNTPKILHNFCKTTKKVLHSENKIFIFSEFLDKVVGVDKVAGGNPDNVVRSNK